MTHRIPAVRLAGVAAFACPLLLAACAPARPSTPSGAPAAPFGSATRAVLALQIADPSAAAAVRNPAASGLDGRAASQALGRYQKSYAEPPAQPSGFAIGVSGTK